MARYDGPIIDTDVHHKWPSDDVIIERLPKQWKDYVFGPGVANRLQLNGPGGGPQHPGGSNKRLETYPAGGGLPGSDYQTMCDQLLDQFHMDRAVLSFDGAPGAVSVRPAAFAHAVSAAINDWNAETWLSIDDDRLYSSVLTPTQLPVKAAEEIRRVGANPKIVAVLLSFNGLDRPFGHPNYNPIFAAAQEMDLPIAMHGGGGEGLGGVLSLIAGGRPNTRLEQHTLLLEGGIHHVLSLILNGTFDKYPKMKVLAIEIGTAWLAWLAWVLDAHENAIHRDYPDLKRKPSDYLRDHFYVTTQPLEMSPRPEQLHELYGAYGNMENQLCFATDYPHWDADSPDYAMRRLPAEWKEKVMYKNALGAFRWNSDISPELVHAR